MADHRETTAADSAPQTSADESSTEAPAAAAVARMLANPRRIRRA